MAQTSETQASLLTNQQAPSINDGYSHQDSIFPGQTDNVGTQDDLQNTVQNKSNPILVPAQSTQIDQHIHELTKSMSLMLQVIPTIYNNTGYISDIKDQLGALQTTLNSLQAQSQIGIPPPQNPPPSLQPYYNTSPNIPTPTSTQNPPPFLQPYYDTTTNIVTTSTQNPPPPSQIKSPFTLKLSQEVSVPKFDGSNEIPSNFLKKLGKYFFLAGVSSDEYKLHYFEHVLSGKAAAWFQANEYLFTTWPILQESFLNYFQGPYHLEQQKRNWDKYYLSQNDDIDEFILDSINFLQVLYPKSNFNEIAEMIIHKLPKNIRKPLRTSHMNLNSPAILLQAVSDIVRMDELEDEDDLKNSQNYRRANPQPSYTRPSRPPPGFHTQAPNANTQPRSNSRNDGNSQQTTNSRSVNAIARTSQQAPSSDNTLNQTPSHPTYASPTPSPTIPPQNQTSPLNPHTSLHYPQQSIPSDQGNGNQSG